jgi:hypothetical protein
MFMAGAAMAGFFGWVAGAHHIENPSAGNRRPGSDPLPLPGGKPVHIFWTKPWTGAKNNHSGMLRARDRLNSPEPDDPQEVSGRDQTASQQYHGFRHVPLVPRGLTALWYLRFQAGFFRLQGRKGIMNMHRITAMAMAVALTGFAHTLAAEENILTLPADDMLQQDVSEQKPETEILATEFELSAQTVSQPADNLLSDLKVYPSF